MKNLSNYIVTCPIENVLWNESGQPYELIHGAKVILSHKKTSVLNSYNSKN